MSKMAHRPIPYGRQSIDESDIAAVVDVLKSDWLTTGPMVETFEEAFASHVGVAHAVACSSGTAALHLALEALWLAEDDHVVVPAISFLATANAVRFMGAEVIFADVDAETGLMSAAHAESAIKRAAGGNVKAIMPVHFAGQSAHMADLKSFADKDGLSVVEDACHALGASDGSGEEPAPVGACARSDMATFSFHPVKSITTGEGGMVTCQSSDLAERLKRMRNHGMSRDARGFLNAAMAFEGETPNPWYYEMEEVGFNYRLSDIQCALGVSQLARLDEFVARRRALADLYDRELSDLAPAMRPLARQPGGASAWHLYVVLLDFEAIGASRGQVMEALNAASIGSQVHYVPLYRQPYYQQRYGRKTLPGAEAYYERCLSLPIYPGMRDEDVGRVAGTLKKIIGNG